ncbi:hypothetical protein J1N35_025608 [Gossypium stocksii]|uniref:Reverse transcriptase zinc-binding domain-containing protein n=1 Tax=Gossypium stocksii TaxID=47602 RepID=A0A9D3V7C8_9ROSI|nr:hypothetical protein J1N35_025608 [Gossypium stocksii]
MQSLMILKGVCDEIENIARQFIWGSSPGYPNSALVGWKSIYQPKSRGGLGFRHLHDQNNSFLLKIGFNLVSRKDALWVRVLHSKYGWKNQILDTIHRSSCSHLWRSLSKVWSFCRENFIWSVGDGRTIRVWKDAWIPKVGPLCYYVSAHSNIDLECTLKDWVLSDGSWNLEMFQLWFSKDMIKRIVSIPLPHPNGGVDRIIWARSGSGSFSMKSAYWTIKESTWNSKDEV